MKNILPAALAFAVMLAPLSPLMAEDLGVGVGVHVGDQNQGDRHNGEQNRMTEHRSVAGDQNRGCHMVITKVHHDGMTTTKRERKCD